MKIIITISLIAASVILTGYHDGTDDNDVPDYAGPTITKSMEDGFQKTTVDEVESFIGNKLQAPEYLPAGYEVKEVYYLYHSDWSPPAMSVYLLISDQPVEWTGSKFRCRLLIYIGWDRATLGLKMPCAEFIEEAGARLEEEEYILWKSSYGEKMDSTVKVYASREFPRDQLIKIAASIP